MKGDRGFPVRVRFSKRGRIRFISHRDVARAFERAFRIEELPLAFTEGFVPRPRMSFGLALPVGYESEAEYMDVELASPIDLDAVSERISAVLPDGMTVTGVAVLEPRAESLQGAVSAVGYLTEVVSPGAETALDPSDVGGWVDAALRADHLEAVRRRKGREVVEDLRPAIREIAVVGTTERGVELRLEVSTQPRSVRPDEVISVLAGGAVPLVRARALRTDQWIERDGSRLTPLEADTRALTEVGA